MRNFIKRNRILAVLAVILALLLIFVGCGKKEKSITVPGSLSIDDDIFSWDAVSGSYSYDVKIDDEIFSVPENSCDLRELVHDYDAHDVSVRANTYDGSSDFSYVLPYQRQQEKTSLTKLAAPLLNTVTGTRLLWSGVVNNNGYKIFIEGETILVEKNATYYDLTFPRDGTIPIRMQTIGDGLTYSSSDYSSILNVTVKNGLAPLLRLDAPQITFNAETEKIEWENRYSADSAYYEVYDGDGMVVATLAADASFKQMSYAPDFSQGTARYSVVAKSKLAYYKDSLAGNEISFPLTSVPPRSLTLVPDTELQRMRLTWTERVYSAGYRVELDGAYYRTVSTPSLLLPEGLSSGRHVIRVCTMGDNHFYAASVYSAELSFRVEEGGLVTVPLGAAKMSALDFTDDTVIFTFDAVENADYYLVRITCGTEEYTFSRRSTSFRLTASKLNGVTLEGEEKTIAERVIALLPQGIRLTVEARNDSPLYRCVRSEEYFLTSSEKEVAVAPQEFTYTKDGFSWRSAKEGATYDIELDGEIFEEVTPGSTLLPSMAAGAHCARVRVHDGLWSEEISFLTPLEAEAPYDLKVTSGVLSYKEGKNATAYVLYANGAEVTTLRTRQTTVLLSDYLSLDGVYILSLRAKGSGDTLSDSALSEEYKYVKTNGSYGSEAKPHEPTTAEELVAVIKEHPSDVISLVSGGVYDFSQCGRDAYSLDFGGVLIGNGATLKGLCSDRPLFRALTGAKISDLQVELRVDDFAYGENGIFAAEVSDTLLENVRFLLSGETTLRQGASFGLLVYRFRESTVKNCEAVFDLSVTSAQDINVGGFAYSFEGEIDGLTLSGTLSVQGGRLTFGGVGVTGAITGTNLTLSREITLDSSLFLQAGGVARDASVSLGSSNLAERVSLSAPTVIYHGIGTRSVSVENVLVGGNVAAQATGNITMYGVGGDAISGISDVRVTATMRAESSAGEISMAGFSDELLSTSLSEGAVFAGRLEAVGDSDRGTRVAGVAFTMAGDHEVKALGELSVETKGDVEIAGVAFAAEILTVEIESEIKVRNASYAEVAGVVRNVETLVLSGELAVDLASCDEVHFGGAVLGGSFGAECNDYTVRGGISAREAEIGGIAHAANAVSLSSLDLTVSLDLTASERVRAAGGLYSCRSLDLAPYDQDCTVTLAAQGSGTLAGFLLGGSSCALSDLTIGGSLSLVGSGKLCGIAETAGTLSRIQSSVSLTGEGEVTLFGVAGSATSASVIAQKNMAVTMRTDAGVYGGAIGTLGGGELSDARITSVTFTADPSVGGSSALEFYGVVGRARNLSNVEVSDVTFRIGHYDETLFAALAERIAERVVGVSLSYAFDSYAAHTLFGGAFREASGEIEDLTLGGEETPIRVNVYGRTTFGGLAVKGETLTASGRAYLSVTLRNNGSGESLVGGLFSEISSLGEVALDDFDLSFDLTKTSETANAVIGGAAALCGGVLSGARVDLALSDPAEDTIGGVVGRLDGGSLIESAVLGEITANGTVGGLIAETTGGTLNRSFAAVRIVAARGTVGGLIGRVNATILRNVYSLSRLIGRGAGLFGEAENAVVSSVYFAGSATEYALAAVARDCSVNDLFLDASLSDLTAVGEGSLPYALRSFAYGYAGADFDGNWTIQEDRYPYLTAVGYLLPVVSVSKKALESRTFSGDASVDLYALIGRRTVDEATPSVVWVDGGRCLAIENGIATVRGNGNGKLYGMLSGGVIVYELNYTATGFKPEGSGTPADPYLITDTSELSYIETEPDACYKMALPEGSSGVVFDTLCTEVPFSGTLDFDSSLLRDPIFGEGGLFGAIDGGTVKNLVVEDGTLSGVLIASVARNAVIHGISFKGMTTGSASLVERAENCLIEEIVFVVNCEEIASFALIGEMAGGDLLSASLSFTASSDGDVSAFLIGEGQGVSAESVQVYFRASYVSEVRFALSESDVGSTYRKAMILAEMLSGESTGEIAGFAFAGENMTISDSACLIYAAGVPCYPLIKEQSGTLSCDNVKLLSDGGSLPKAYEDMMMSVEDALTVLSSMPGYRGEEGQIRTPLGFELFGAKEASATTIRLLSPNEAGTALLLEEERDLSALLDVQGEKPFAAMIGGISVAGESVALIVTDDSTESYTYFARGYALRPIGTGESTLRFVDLYGTPYEVTVFVEHYVGFAMGDGSEEDPFVISSFEEFLFLDEFASDSYYYTLDEDLSGTVTEPLRFNGILTGTGSLTVTLSDSPLFSTFGGIADGIDFTLIASGGDTPADGVSALFAREGNGAVIRNASIVVEAGEISTEASTFGVLFGRGTSGSALKNVTIDFGDITASAENGTFGLIAGEWTDSYLQGVRIEGSLTLTGTGATVVGAIGSLSSSNERPDEENYYIDDVTLIVALEVTTEGTLTIGAFAGSGRTAIRALDLTVDMTFVGGRVIAGGALGEGTSSLIGATGVTEMSGSAVGGYFGGLVGYASSSEAAILDCDVAAVISVTAAGECIVGGVLGYGEGCSVKNVKVEADLSARSLGSAEAILGLKDRDGEYVPLAAAGGAVGYSSGEIIGVSVTVVGVSASSDYLSKDLAVLAGGLGAYLREAEDVEVKGTGRISSSGGEAVTGGVAAILRTWLERAVISEVTLVGDTVGGVAGVFPLRADGELIAAFSLLTLSESTGAIVGTVPIESGRVSGCAYLSGTAVGGEIPTGFILSASKESAEYFLQENVYISLGFDEAIWIITGDQIPTLR